MKALCVAVFVICATTAQAQTSAMRPEARPAPDVAEVVALRPQTRPDSLVPPPPGDPTVEMRPSARPFERPDLARGATTQPQQRAEVGMFAFSPNAIAQSLRPTVRPAAITQRAVEQRIARQRGQVCGDPAIQGETIGRVPGRGACGIESAVRVRSVAGVRLSPSATIDCRTASALKVWVAQSAKPAVGQIGGGMQSLRVVSHYACRNRNSSSTGRLSEHAFGRAIDIAGIGLKSGSEITVLTDWNRGQKGEALRRMWRGACGPFGTVLGPNANAAHRDHFHFDTARYRSGSYCR
ncbi:extensin family protein [Yoonia sp. R2331]|uniref:extensin-like domain-containing protein n=1 Tax=Yoonia sp. R2331 TaxID=3237238 RepID=UPI0034E3AB27